MMNKKVTVAVLCVMFMVAGIAEAKKHSKTTTDKVNNETAAADASTASSETATNAVTNETALSTLDAPVRVAMRRGCMKECISGTAFTDVVINTFFGFSPAPDDKTALADPQTSRPFLGTLHGLRYRGKLHQLTASEHGLKITETPDNREKGT